MKRISNLASGFLLLVISSHAFAQVTVVNGGDPVSGGVVTSTSPADTTSTYSVTTTETGTQTYNFGQGNERFLQNFNTAQGTYEDVNETSNVEATIDVRIRRNGTTGPFIPFSPIYEATSVSGSTYNLAPSQRFTAEEILEGGAINVALADSLSNATSGNASRRARGKDIERLDFIYNNGMAAQSEAQRQFGFLITDITTTSSSVESAGVVAITGLDSSGDPSSFGDVVVTWNNDPGAIVSETAANQMIFTGNYDGRDALPSFAANVNQGIFGRVITLEDLGVNVGEVIYGFALLGLDTVSLIDGQDSDLLLDWTDTAYYPLNTAAGDGDLDISGGTGVVYANSDASNFVQPEPVLAMAPLALLLCLFNRRLMRRLR